MAPAVGVTGNPFVDWGLSIAAAMAGVEDVGRLTVADLRRTVGDGLRIAREHQRLKSFIPLFGSNTPLHNPKKKGQSPGEEHAARYAALIKAIADSIGAETLDAPCEVCGRQRSLDLAQVPEAGGKGSDRLLGRDWFPLAGAKTDANLLPAASRAVHVCAACLLAVRFLPSAPLLVDGRMTILQSAPPEFADLFCRDLWTHVSQRVRLGNVETEGSKEGTRALLRRLLGVLDNLAKKKRLSVVSAETRLFSWRFSNAGDSADVELEEIPNRVLLFLRDARDLGFQAGIDRLVSAEKKKDSDATPGLLRCLMQGRDYEPLYPRGSWEGASPGFFELYQARILGRTAHALATARTIAAAMVAASRKKKDLDRLRKPEALGSPSLRATVRKAMVNEALEGRFSLQDYRSLFPLHEPPGVSIDPSGFKVLRFYLHHAEGPAQAAPVEQGLPSPESKDPVLYLADRMLARLLEVREADFVRARVLPVLERQGGRWLASQFERCAAREEGFTYDVWTSLALDSRGRFWPHEWTFQTRLHLAARLAASTSRPELAAARADSARPFDGSGLPTVIVSPIESYLGEYARSRGTERLLRDVVERWLDREIGAAWLGKRLCDPVRERRLEETTWSEWLTQGEAYERRFQLGLAIGNASRRLSNVPLKEA